MLVCVVAISSTALAQTPATDARRIDVTVLDERACRL
jgi:hypothetical protein